MPDVRVDASVGGSDAGMNASSDPCSALLEVRALSKSFGTLQALQEVDFTLRAGEIHALLGENGAGKSTLIKAVTGVFPRDAGIVRLGDRKSTRLNSSHSQISYAVFCLKKKKTII